MSRVGVHVRPVTVPQDHFSSSSATIDITFAVHPAQAERVGALVFAMGGPGNSGVSAADAYLETLDQLVTDSFDIVFFDQRGIGLSGGLTCWSAAVKLQRANVYSSHGIDHRAIEAASADFVVECLAEIGAVDNLPYLDTRQAVADLESFRVEMGYEKLLLYGQSYGTQLVQIFAAEHPERVDRVILDSTIDLTLDPLTFLREQSHALERTLQMTFEACDSDPRCVDDVGGSAGASFQELMERLSDSPIATMFPLENGRLARRVFTQADLVTVTTKQMYSDNDRMVFLRALAAYAVHKDIVPFLSLLYSGARIDPVTEVPVDNTSVSTPVYYSVECLDYSFPGETPGDKAKSYIDAGTSLKDDPLSRNFYVDLPCAYWPTGRAPTPSNLEAGNDILILLLSSTADPVAPSEQSTSVAKRLGQSYLVTKQGGSHVLFGRNDECIDREVTTFVVYGGPPSRLDCPGQAISPYVPLSRNHVEAIDLIE